jgi:acetoin utilization deacetylase AcuC-like enzyme
MHLYYSPAYIAAAQVFDTTRKSGWIAASLVRRPVSGVDIVEPPAVTARQLETVHTPEYVRAVRTGMPHGLAESNGFSWIPRCGTRCVRPPEEQSRRR